MEELKRYKHVDGRYSSHMDERKNGEYVRFADIESLLNKKPELTLKEALEALVTVKIDKPLEGFDFVHLYKLQEVVEFIGIETVINTLEALCQKK